MSSPGTLILLAELDNHTSKRALKEAVGKVLYTSAVRACRDVHARFVAVGFDRTGGRRIRPIDGLGELLDLHRFLLTDVGSGLTALRYLDLSAEALEALRRNQAEEERLRDMEPIGHA